MLIPTTQLSNDQPIKDQQELSILKQGQGNHD